MKKAAYKTEIGYITLAEDDRVLASLSFGKNTDKNEETAFLKRCYEEIEEYLSGTRQVFDIKYRVPGSGFYKRVWEELVKIPYGETRTYSEIAKCLGNEKAARAVGMACNKNEIAIVIPCHRVIGKNGNLTGFAGGLDVKEKLLSLERKGGSLIGEGKN